MSAQYKPKHNTDLQMADALPVRIGRGNGMTIKEMRRRLKAREKQLGIGCQRWRLRARLLPPRSLPAATTCL